MSEKIRKVEVSTFNVPLDEFLEVTKHYDLKVQTGESSAWVKMPLMHTDAKVIWFLDGGLTAWRKHLQEMETES